MIATQNPVETAGTFPLPEAQLDRFMMKLSMGLPTLEEEKAVLHRYGKEDPLKTLAAVVTQEEILAMKKEISDVFVHESIEEYIASITAATRSREKVIAGASTRAALALLRAVKAYAALEGRNYCIPDDVKKLAVPVLAHRLVVSYGYQKGQEAEKIVREILETVPVPTEDFAW